MAWQLFDQQAAMFGKPTAIWVQVCVFTQGATIAQVDDRIQLQGRHLLGAEEVPLLCACVVRQG